MPHALFLTKSDIFGKIMQDSGFFIPLFLFSISLNKILIYNENRNQLKILEIA